MRTYALALAAAAVVFVGCQASRIRSGLEVGSASGFGVTIGQTFIGAELWWNRSGTNVSPVSGVQTLPAASK